MSFFSRSLSLTALTALMALAIFFSGAQIALGAQATSCPQLEGLYKCPEVNGLVEIRQKSNSQGITEYLLSQEGVERVLRADGQTSREEELVGAAYYRRKERIHCDAGKLKIDSKMELSWDSDFSSPFYVGLTFYSMGRVDSELVSVTDVVEWLIDPETDEPVHEEHNWINVCRAVE